MKNILNKTILFTIMSAILCFSSCAPVRDEDLAILQIVHELNKSAPTDNFYGLKFVKASYDSDKRIMKWLYNIDNRDLGDYVTENNTKNVKIKLLDGFIDAHSTDSLIKTIVNSKIGLVCEFFITYQRKSVTVEFTPEELSDMTLTRLRLSIR